MDEPARPSPPVAAAVEPMTLEEEAVLLSRANRPEPTPPEPNLGLLAPRPYAPPSRSHSRILSRCCVCIELSVAPWEPELRSHNHGSDASRLFALQSSRLSSLDSGGRQIAAAGSREFDQKTVILPAGSGSESCEKTQPFRVPPWNEAKIHSCPDLSSLASGGREIAAAGSGSEAGDSGRLPAALPPPPAGRGLQAPLRRLLDSSHNGEPHLLSPKRYALSEAVNWLQDGNFWMEVAGLSDGDEDTLPPEVPVHEPTKVRLSAEEASALSCDAVGSFHLSGTT